MKVRYKGGLAFLPVERRFLQTGDEIDLPDREVLGCTYMLGMDSTGNPTKTEIGVDDLTYAFAEGATEYHAGRKDVEIIGERSKPTLPAYVAPDSGVEVKTEAPAPQPVMKVAEAAVQPSVSTKMLTMPQRLEEIGDKKL